MNSFRSSFLLYICIDLVYIYFVRGLIILDLVWRVQAVKHFFTTSNYSSHADLSVLWKSYTIAKQANLVIMASESRSIKQPSNIYVDAGRYQRPRYCLCSITLQSRSCYSDSRKSISRSMANVYICMNFVCFHQKPQ